MEHLPKRLSDPESCDDVSAPSGTFDSHVHIFPDGLYRAIWRWFDQHAWDIRYRFFAEQVDAFLTARNVQGYLALHYAHKPGIANGLNQFVLEFAKNHPRCIPAATVFPGEASARKILHDALSAGARAVKMHAHVQCVAPDDPRMDEIYDLLSEWGRPLVFHCGNEPDSAAYHCDVGNLCRVEKVAEVLQKYPRLRLVVPHLGFGEIDNYAILLGKFEHLYVDTAMGLANYFPGLQTSAEQMVRKFPDKVLYGTDFPHLPYAWNRDLTAVLQLGLSPDDLAKILGKNFQTLFLQDR